MPNAALAKRIYDQVTAEPETFNMRYWFDGPDQNAKEIPATAKVSCGTTMCIAGWACHLNGYTLRSTSSGVMAIGQEGWTEDIESLAQELLGVPDFKLFHVQRDDVAIEMLRQIIEGRDLDFADAERIADEAHGITP